VAGSKLRGGRIVATRPTQEYLVTSFRHFAQICASSNSPLYSALSSRVAEDEAVRSLAGCSTERQPPPNMLFGAVHFLLLRGAPHDLRMFYPSVGGRSGHANVWPAFRDFCEEYRDGIVQLVASRRVQTNEVGRCGPLLVGMTFVERMFHGQPLAIIEVGASAGLNLLFDQYNYEYVGEERLKRLSTRPSHSASSGALPVVIRMLLRGQLAALTPVPETMPLVVSRVGIDLAPVDVRDDDATQWVESMIWPDQIDRIELFRSAVRIARINPPRIVPGDAMDVVAALIESAPSGAIPCVFHTHATYQMSSAWRAAFESLIVAAARRMRRDVAHLFIEWLSDEPGPEMRLTIHRADGDGVGSVAKAIHLASCHHHGKWMNWKVSRGRA
jgi:hypothetical protein